MRVDQPNGEAGVAGEGPVDRALAQDLAVDAVGGDRGRRANHVAGVDVLAIALRPTKMQYTFLRFCILFGIWGWSVANEASLLVSGIRKDTAAP